MSVYARSDMMSVSIPAESGGCGQTHSRPVLSGSPAKVWRLTCPQCEGPIREDIARSSYSLIENGKKVVHNLSPWSDSQLKIPLTPDEEEMATEMERSGQTIMHQVAEGMSKQAIETLQKQQTQEIEETEAKVAAAAATDRVAQLEAQLAEMQSLLQQLANPSQVKVLPVARKVIKDVESGKAAALAEVVANATSGACESCGGPLRKPGQKGPTPKSKCYDCRAAEYASKKAKAG